MSDAKQPFDFILGGSSWRWLCLGTVLLAAFLFSTAPAVWVHTELPLPPAYELKAQNPFADTTALTIPEHEGERSHGAKIAPRLVGSILLYVARSLGLHPYWPAALFGALFLLGGIEIGFRLTKDRVIGLFMGLTFAGLYATSGSFGMNWMPKPFDGVAMGMLGLAMLGLGRPWLWAGAAFLSLWTDERSLVALGLLALLICVYPGWTKKQQWTHWISLGVACVAYGIARIALILLLQWNMPDTSMLGHPLRLVFIFIPVAAWTCFEGGWILVLYAGRSLYQARAPLLWLYSTAAALAILSCLIVLDISRAAMFAFPMIPVALAALQKQGTNLRELRLLMGASAAVSLLSPNFEIILGRAVQWLPAFPQVWVSSLMQP